MPSKQDKLKNDLDILIDKGQLLYYTLVNDLEKFDKKSLDHLKKEGVKFFTNFKKEYEKWYSESYEVIKIILPDRLQDFVSYYKKDKRKDITYETYTMSDYIIGLQVTRGYIKEPVVDTSASITKLEAQKNILESCKRRFESTLFDLMKFVQADLFDNELDAAKVLNKNGFVRAAGAMAGVVLERHLSEICKQHSITFRKKNLTINDFNESLKNNSIIDISTWRNIQFLADIRNMCDHNKKEEPKKEQVNDLIDGVNKIIKTI